jgi:hypothetical protein
MTDNYVLIELNTNVPVDTSMCTCKEEIPYVIDVCPKNQIETVLNSMPNVQPNEIIRTYNNNFEFDMSNFQNSLNMTTNLYYEKYYGCDEKNNRATYVLDTYFTNYWINRYGDYPMPYDKYGKVQITPEYEQFCEDNYDITSPIKYYKRKTDIVYYVFKKNNNTVQQIMESVS